MTTLAADFRTLFEAAQHRYLVLDRDLTIVAVTDAYLAVTMTKREEVVGRPLFEVFPDAPDDLEATGVRSLAASLAQVLKTAETHRMPETRYPIRRPDGTWEERWWLPTNSPVFDEHGVVQNIIHCAEDITEIHGLRGVATERDALAEELRRRMQQAMEINDNVIQGLTAAQLALDLERIELTSAVLAQTMLGARKIISDLIARTELSPGALIRERPAP